jgi:hypothetical protein
MGTIWGPPNRGKQIITVFLRESRRTSDILLEGERFTVCFFPEKNRKDLGMHSGHNEPGANAAALQRNGKENYRRGRISFSKKVRVVSGVREKASPSTVTHTPFWQLPIQN